MYFSNVRRFFSICSSFFLYSQPEPPKPWPSRGRLFFQYAKHVNPVQSHVVYSTNKLLGEAALRGSAPRQLEKWAAGRAVGSREGSGRAVGGGGAKPRPGFQSRSTRGRTPHSPCINHRLLSMVVALITWFPKPVHSRSDTTPSAHVPSSHLNLDSSRGPSCSSPQPAHFPLAPPPCSSPCSVPIRRSTRRRFRVLAQRRPLGRRRQEAHRECTA